LAHLFQLQQNENYLFVPAEKMAQLAISVPQSAQENLQQESSI